MNVSQLKYLPICFPQSPLCICRTVIAILVFIGINPVVGSSQQNNFDEVLVMLHVERVGSVELPAVIYKQEAYLPVKDIFNFLKIKTRPSAASDTLTGFFHQSKSDVFD